MFHPLKGLKHECKMYKIFKRIERKMRVKTFMHVKFNSAVEVIKCK